VRAGLCVIKLRLAGRRMYSDADFEVYKEIESCWEPFCEPHLILESTQDNIEDMLREAENYLIKNHDQRANT